MDRDFNKQGNYLNVEFKVTNDCNFRCKYCFEHGSFGERKISHKEIHKLLERVELLRNSNEFKNRFDGMVYTLWGGEPSLNMKTCIEIIKHAESLGSTVQMYSNGTGLQSLQEYMRSGVLKVQISYDGEPVNSLKRVNANGTPTTDFVRRQIDFMIEKDLPFVLKSTITPDTFKNMPECWKDINDIRQRCSDDKKGNISYCPTIDFYNIDPKFKDDLKKSIIEMAKLEKANLESNNGQFVLSWFGETGESFCSAGAHMIVLDMDGNVYPCHGCLYAEEESKGKLNWCSIYDPDFINIITEKIDLHKKIMYNVPDDCVDTYYTYNVRCNSESFNKSSKENYEDRWTDFTNYKPLNEYYEIISKVTLALKNIMEKK